MQKRPIAPLAKQRGGVPPGGTTGQVLAKNSNKNFDTGFISTGGTGTVTSLTATAPVTITPSPTTTTGVISTSMNTGVLLGRGSVGVGVAQEIAIGSGLSLSSTTLSATGGSGTVTTTGSPASGNLTKFSGATSITNGDLSGDVTTSGTLATTIANQAVTYAKMQNVSVTSRFLGRITAGAGSPEELTAANAKTILALTSSDVGLSNVTNDAQTKAAIVPNTVPSAGQILVGNAGGTAYAPVTVTGATLSSTGAFSQTSGQIPDLGANPGHLIGMSVVNGVATTYLRSDGAPAIDPAIGPTWTNFHTWIVTDSKTNAITTNLVQDHETSGTPVAGFGVGNNFRLQDSTTANQQAANLNVLWTDATHGTHTAAFDIQLSNLGGAPASMSRFSGAGGLSVGATVDPGAGIVNANVGFKVANAAGIGGQELVSDGTEMVVGNSAPDTMQNYGSISIPDTSNLNQPDALVLTGTANATLAGTGNINLYDSLGAFPGKRSFSPGSFTLKPGEYFLQYQKLLLNGNQNITLMGDAQLIVSDLVPTGSLALAGT